MPNSNHSLRWNKPPKRVVLKLSGEALKPNGTGDIIDWQETARIAGEITAVHKKHGTEIAVVIGAGNIWRGTQGTSQGMNPSIADEMGMIATTINALALQSAFKYEGYETRVMTAIHMDQVMEKYIRQRAIRHLEKGRVVVLAGGTGVPNVTTDTASVNRAIELEADLLLKGTHGTTDGVYTADPRRNPSAQKFNSINFDEVIQRRLKVMDGTAFTLAHDAPHKLDLVVFNVKQHTNLERVIAGEPVGTLVTHAGATALAEPQ